MNLIINIANNLHYDNLIKFLMEKSLKNTDFLYISMNHKIIKQSNLKNKLYINRRNFDKFSLKETLKHYKSINIIVKLPILNNYQLKLNYKLLNPTYFNLINIIIQEAKEFNIDTNLIVLYPLDREKKDEISNLNIKKLNKLTNTNIIYLQKAFNEITKPLKKDFDKIVFEEIYHYLL